MKKGKHIYFVRHGESSSNNDGILLGKHAQLTGTGRLQALIVPSRILKIGADAILASTYPRAKETADIIGGVVGLLVETSDLLIEIEMPSLFHGRHRDEPEILKIADEIFERRHEAGYRYSDEETLNEFRTRANDALNFLQTYEAERICVVTHGAFMRALFCSVLYGREFSGHEFNRALNSLFIDNTSITYFRWQPVWRDEKDKHWAVISWNDSAHLG